LPQLTEQGRQKIDELAQRYAVSTDAVMTLLQALVNSNGTMAHFNHPELGGGGQWMLGGMTMVRRKDFLRGIRRHVQLRPQGEGRWSLFGAIPTPGPAALRAGPGGLPVAVARWRSATGWARGRRFFQLVCPRAAWPRFTEKWRG
jgi:hypothetical protein